MDRKTALITGGSSGLGKAAAEALARRDYDLLLLARHEDDLRKACRDVSRKTGNPRVKSLACDLSSLSAVRRAAETILAAYPRLDVLINNAGARFLRHQTTPEGIEATLATNHLGPFVLTLSLGRLLADSAPARIINVSSGTHAAGGSVIENVLSPGSYDGRRQYADSKLANILFTYALADRLGGLGIAVQAVDPGGLATNFARNDGLGPWLRHLLYYVLKGRLRTPAQAGAFLARLADDAAYAGITGKFFREEKEAASSDFSYDQTARDGLWALSVRLGGIDLPSPRPVLTQPEGRSPGR